MIEFKTPREIHDEYGISLATIYRRIHDYSYRTNDNNEILLADVLNDIGTDLKKGRPKGSPNKKKCGKGRNKKCNK